MRYALRTPTGSTGYPQVNLFTGTGRKTFAVHTLVARAFHGDPVVRHLNGDPSDNRAENLVWGTQKQNTWDTVDHGHHPNASKQFCVHGHEFTPENTYSYVGDNGRPKRKCRECGRRSSNERYARKRAEQPSDSGRSTP